MRRLYAFLALVLLAATDSLSAQGVDAKVRVLAWYARLVANSAVPPYSIVFLLPSSAPNDSKLELQLPVLRLALKQASVPTTSESRAPGRDTLLVFLGIPEPDSVKGEWIHYTVYSQQTDGGPRRETGIYAARLHCSLKQCFFISLQAVDSGEASATAMPHGLPPNNALLQSPHTLAVCCAVLRQRSVYGVQRSRTRGR